MGNARSLSGFVVLLSTFVPVSAQWLNYPTPGIPRTPDGKPKLTAPAPKMPDGKPDLSGIWMRRDNYLQNLAKDGVKVPFQPWAEALYKQRLDNLSKGTPGERCLPRGVPAEMMTPNPFKLVQIPGWFCWWSVDCSNVGPVESKPA